MEITDHLGKLANFYSGEATKCIKGKAYLAACVTSVITQKRPVGRF